MNTQKFVQDTTNEAETVPLLNDQLFQGYRYLSGRVPFVLGKGEHHVMFILTNNIRALCIRTL